MSLIDVEESINKAKKGEILPVFSCFRITNRCNLKCQYCSVNQTHKELSLEEIKEAVDILYSLGNRQINITGGEPLLREDVFDIVQYVSSKGSFVSLSTNGILMDNIVYKRFNDANLNSLSISLDSVKQHPDYGKELNLDFKRRLEQLSEFDRKFEVILVPVISSDNVGELESIVNFSEDLGFSTKFMLVMPLPDGTYVQGKDLEESKKIISAIGKLQEMKNQGYSILDSDEHFEAMKKYLRDGLKFNCPVEYDLSINSDGRIVICPDNIYSELKIFDLDSKEKYLNFVEWSREKVQGCKGCLWGHKYRLANLIK